MHSFIRWSLATVLLAVIQMSAAFSAASGREVRPPFGMVWGLEFQRVEESVQAAGGHVVERVQDGAGGERWTVEGIPQEGLQRALFTFDAGHLLGVELQYGNEQWDTQMYDGFMRQVKSGLDAEHGGGRLLVRQRAPDSGVLKTMLGYSWAGGAQSVTLLYFSAQDERNIFRLVSLHYSARVTRTMSQVAGR